LLAAGRVRVEHGRAFVAAGETAMPLDGLLVSPDPQA
jgi:hypothetical protein